MRNIQEKFEVEVKFPIIADLDQKVSRLYGMLHEPTSATAAVRCVFFLDPKRAVRAMIYYPLNLGRNFDEILRVVDGLQTADSNGVACPANWTTGEDVIVPPPTTMDLAAERVADSSVTAKDWYFAKKSL
jgi:peroxiredoxin (alkyl hydroperoxide reductase subunit C)